MPLISRFESYDRPGYVKDYPAVIARGNTGCWENHSAGFVIAMCSVIDLGGVVFETEDPKMTALGAAIVRCTEENLAGHILPGLDIRLPFVEDDDEEGILIIQHEMPGGIRSSLS
jgi:hypothetical protein